MADHVPVDDDHAHPARYRELGWWRDETFVDDLQRWSRERPDDVALISHFWETSDEPDVQLTYAALARYVDRAALGLWRLGVGKGDRVAMQLVNQWQATVLVLACARIGAVISPFFIGAGASDIERILTRNRASVCVALGEVRGINVKGALAEIKARSDVLQHLVILGDADSVDAIDFDTHFVRTPWEEYRDVAELDGAAPSADDVFQVLFTSGTTGEPKGTLHTYNTLYAMARSYTVPMDIGPADTGTTPCIVGGQGGFLYGILVPLVAGATAVWSDAFRAADYLDLAERYEMTYTYLTPAVMQALVEEQHARPRQLCLRKIVVGSTPVGSQLAVDVMNVFGTPMRALWGMTENGGVTLNRLDDPWDRAVYSDGRPVPWMQVRIVDADDIAVAEGEVGRLQVRGANQCVGYFEAAELYASMLHDGWFETGDLVRSDGHAGIKFVGRTKDLINKGGLHVPSVEVEDVLRGHPKVADVAVVGEPEPMLGERVVAVVEVSHGAEAPALEELHEHMLAARMTAGYSPDRLEITESLPRNANGKILKRDLEKQLSAG